MIGGIQQIKVNAREALSDISDWLYGVANKAYAENRLASVSSWKFVRCFEPVAKEICEWSTSRYCDLCEEARARILNGEEITDVLWRFDMKLEQLKREPAQPPQEG